MELSALDQQQGLSIGKDIARTLFNAVLLGGFTVGLGACDTLDALVEVVLGRGALLGVPAL
jgi:hypothetical protein